MKKERYTTKTGKQQWRPVISKRNAYRVMDESQGFCLACGEYGQPAEPDAQQYTCESCGQPKVYGMLELLFMNLVVIKERS